MTLAQLQSLVRNLVFERTGEVGLVTDPELTEIINSAVRAVYLDIARYFPEAFAERTAELTVGTPFNKITYSTITPTGQPVHKILTVGVGTTPGGAKKPILPLNRPIEKLLYEPAATAPASPYRWYIESANIYFTPPASGTFYAEVAYVRTPGPDLSGASDTPWANQLTEHHDKIAILAAKIVYGKDEKNQSPYDSFLEYLQGQLADQLRQSPRDFGKKTREMRKPDETS